MAKVGQLVKESIVQELSDNIRESSEFFVTTIGQLTSDDSNELRMRLVKSGARLHMVKRTMGRRVIDTLDIGGLPDLSEIRNASVGLVVTDENAVDIAKSLVDFGKDHEALLEIHAAKIEGQILGKDRVKEVAKLPSREVLLSQVIATVEAPINEVATLLERLIGDLIQIVEAATEKKPAEPAKATEKPSAEPEAKAEEKATETPAESSVDAPESAEESNTES